LAFVYFPANSGLVTVGNSAFEGCSSLRDILLPLTLLTIGDAAFKETGLITFYTPDLVTSIGGSAFLNCPSLVGVSVPPTLTYV
jgi:hypothetical protein